MIVVATGGDSMCPLSFCLAVALLYRSSSLAAICLRRGLASDTGRWSLMADVFVVVVFGEDVYDRMFEKRRLRVIGFLPTPVVTFGVV
uniref:Putative secreted peptide n=1 Tax=Anopheles braziliensis TaxID=58242 RepID=A0A2M3ZUM1_9DIPT